MYLLLLPAMFATPYGETTAVGVNRRCEGSVFANLQSKCVSYFLLYKPKTTSHVSVWTILGINLAFSSTFSYVILQNLHKNSEMETEPV